MRSAAQPAAAGEITPPTTSPDPMMTAIAVVICRGLTVSEGIVPMNKGKAPVNAHPKKKIRARIQTEP
jgi:hypothetical protein